MRVVSQYVVSNNDAGPKAKTDIEQILKSNYDAKVFTNKVKNNKEKNINNKIKKFLFSYKALNTNEITIIQIPFTNKIKILDLAKNKIGIIHDVNGIRYNNEELLKQEINAFNQYKGIIVHNDTMKDLLIEKGLKTDITEIELFDYLVDEEFYIKEKKFDKKNIKIAYPGNLEPNKAKFIYDLNETEMNFELCIYGNYLEREKIKNRKIVYKGSFPPNKIVNNLDEDLGLVWSGCLDEKDEKQGEKGYTKYNTPHKLSCFLTAGIPVIVWEKSAIAKIVEKYDIGYKINNVYDINKINFDDYDRKKENTINISKKLREGYFTKKAIEEMMKKI